MKKQSFLIYPLLIMGIFLVFASSCKKDDDDDNGGNNGGDNGVIPVLTTTVVTELTQTTAKSGGNITSDGGATVTARGVCWSTGHTPTVIDNKTIDGTGAGVYSSNLSGLSSGTTYYVRAYATNSAGTGYGSAMSFTTLQGNSGSSFTDPRDGNVYQTVTIGNQVWMAENLKYLPSVVGSATGSETTPYYYVYGYDGTDVNAAKATSNYSTYGVLYNWTAAVNACPAGWHLPSDAEWTILTNHLGTDAGSKLAGNAALWTDGALDQNANFGETGFTALPGGHRYYPGAVDDVGNFGFWWSATERDATSAWYRNMFCNDSGVGRIYHYKGVGFSVRCVRD